MGGAEGRWSVACKVPAAIDGRLLIDSEPRERKSASPKRTDASKSKAFSFAACRASTAARHIRLCVHRTLTQGHKTGKRDTRRA
ncbi:hypothetical protein CEXT_46061 [Caerostris extrusa]|uniref:Uncharacterized protein n=1 Tax=Caerostris extrusa TaxID=172846 RepID=A0AAV4XE32_CAEEX|nr:hypothetical protein CEXT_46061 [Caerostris extrusa]